MSREPRARTGLARARGSLLVVGTGITGVGHLTLEARECLERAGTLFYAVPDPATECWIRSINRGARSLADFYAEGKPRQKTYEEIVELLVSTVVAGTDVTAAFYGHPGVLVEASHVAIGRLRRKGYLARMLPGISAEDCLFADLGVNPGDHGLQSYEATDFLMYRRRFDPASAMILWQVGVLGESRSHVGGRCDRRRLATLVARLRPHYPRDHKVVLYQAASFPGRLPLVKRVALARLSAATVRPTMLLYVPPGPQRSPDPRILRWYDER
jgi:Tetrapyrrole (Corrin/Porphyrin) Methylases